jgi:uncharacterized membrane-anchored protein
MRFRLAIGAVVLQVLALVYMAGEREWIIRHGRTVLLRTAPIDPNDPMRGDYVRLDYDISRVPRHLLAGGLPAAFAGPWDYRQQSERRVYAPLRVSEDGVADLIALTDVRPAEGIFIRGHAQNAYGPHVHARYGIEAFFMQQGTAKKLEDARARDRPGVPLNIEVAIGSSGIAVIKGYHWEPLGITVAFERAPRPARAGESDAPGSNARQQFISGLTVELKNYGPAEVAIVDLPNASSFRLVPNERWQEARYRWVGESTPPQQPGTTPTAAHIVVLKPGQIHTTKIDLTQPRWFVTHAGPGTDPKPIALRDVTDPWSASFRVEYAPPTKAATAHLPHADLIRHGRIRSRAFNAAAGLD